MAAAIGRAKDHLIGPVEFAKDAANFYERTVAEVFVEYDRSPEARYPVAIEQGYASARWIVREGAANGLDRSTSRRDTAIDRRVTDAT